MRPFTLRRFLLSARRNISAGAGYIPPPPPALGSFLKSYGTNLSKLAEDDKLDPCVDRDKEIDRAIQILSRRTKNNPIFLGDGGVGKTAVAEGIALRIAHGNVPQSMKNRIIISLDIASLLAGTKFRGEFEERLKGILENVERAGDRIILFIDEIHIIAGAGAGEGGIDASNILKPPLARGLLRCMGATTTEEYRKYIEKDGALARRFQPVIVKEPTVASAEIIISGLRPKYEKYHNVKITDDAVKTAVGLSSRYIMDRRLPDKAIDVIDEAAAQVRLRQESRPPSCVALEEEAAVLTTRARYLDDQKAQQQEQEFDAEKCAQIDREIADVARRADKNSSLLRAEIEAWVSQHNTVTGAAVADIVANNTGIPVGALLEGERKSLMNMEQQLGEEVLGQEKAISAICKCIRISRAGLRFHERPLGVFLLLGATGVGKTELAKALSRYLFHDSGNMLRLDMSEYMERFSVSRLIGSPPGYVGFEEGGILTEAIRRKPYQVILLDEFEKAHNEVSNVLLQVFDEGRLGDSHGRVVDFRNTVVLMTSNLGVEELYKEENKDDSSFKANKAVTELVNSHFSSEFVNRIDEIIVFKKLGVESTRAIFKLQLSKLHKLLQEKDVELEVTVSAEDYLVSNGHNPKFGARHLKRLMQSELLTPLSHFLLDGCVKGGSKVTVATGDAPRDGLAPLAFTRGGSNLVDPDSAGATLSFYVK